MVPPLCADLAAIVAVSGRTRRESFHAGLHSDSSGALTDTTVYGILTSERGSDST